jgi:predicted DNA-binding ribbon-helix-helix protein
MLILNAMRKRMDKVVQQLQTVEKSKKQEKITLLLTKIQESKDALPEQKNYAMKYRLYVLNYMEKSLIEGY